FGGAGGRAAMKMINAWGDIVIVGGIFPLIVADIPEHLGPIDADYFRASREVRLGRKLEEAAADRDKAVIGFRRSMEPLRLTLRTQAPGAKSCSTRSTGSRASRRALRSRA